MRQISVTTWIVLALCVLVGVVAVAMTAVVVVRLNRQVLASAAELRAGLASTSATTVDAERAELLRYASDRAAIEAQWAATVADYRLRYADDAIYASLATAQVVQTINSMRRPPSIAELHERWAQAWSDRDASLAILARPDVAEDERTRALELGRRANDELRRVHNDLADFLLAQGFTQDEVASAVGPPTALVEGP